MSAPELPSRAAVFPLPNCVLFPKVHLPLRIFEPRYLLMLEQVLDSRGWMAVGLLKTDRERGENGFPDIFPTLGIGRVIDYQKADDGTFKIDVQGEFRVRVDEWLQVEPFPIATFREYPELEPTIHLRDDIRGRLRVRIRDLVRKSFDSQVLMLLDRTIKECDEIGPLVDSIGYYFLRDPFSKQRLLEIQDAVERERALLEILRREKYGAADPEAF